MKHYPTFRLSMAALCAAGLAACASTPLPPEQPRARVAVPQPSPEQGRGDTLVAAPAMGHAHMSNAANPRAYRQDAAHHIYEQNSTRIFKGRLPPLLYAIGVTQVDIDSRGNVQKINWMRAPTHAPEVVHEIERTIRAGAPYPVPARMGHVTYTDTWLWHKSGKFQLDTLTEGQD